jgi:hypothetical protein
MWKWGNIAYSEGTKLITRGEIKSTSKLPTPYFLFSSTSTAKPFLFIQEVHDSSPNVIILPYIIIVYEGHINTTTSIK